MIETIFETLDRNKICYAVCVSINTYILPSVENNKREYFIIGSAKDKKKLIKIGFYKSEHSTKLLMRMLKDSEVRLFKQFSESFNKVIHDKDGRVYELPNNSFKKYYVNS